MIRTVRTLLLSAAALGALATAAIAAPTPPTSDGVTGGMAGMHATGTTQMHTTGGGMDGTHAPMMADPAVHDLMLPDAAMQAHLAEFGIDADQMRRWHDEGRSVDEMHERLADQGIDVDAMRADGPMLTDGPMTSMHGDGDLHTSGHHRTPAR